MDVAKLTKELVVASQSKDEELALDLLKQLDGMQITREVLQTSNAGVELNKLAKADWSTNVAEKVFFGFFFFFFMSP